MADAIEMIDRCFRHQHPEAFGGTEILPDFPREANSNAELVPPGFNREGALWMPDPVPSWSA